MRCVIKLFGIIFMISILSLVTIHTASAAPVIYSFSGTASGDLDGGNFASKNFVINLYGNTDDITTDINGVLWVEGPATFWIADVNDGTFNTDKSIFYSDNNDKDLIGFNKNQAEGHNDVMLFKNTAFHGYDLTAPYGPITTTSSYTLNFYDIPTSKGELTFISAVSNVTFEATAVPIPGAVWLLGSGLIGIVGIRRKFKT